MYHVYPMLTTPPDSTKLWRYLDLSHFLWLLSRRSLYFANVRQFDDHWEGALPAGTVAALELLLGISAMGPRGFPPTGAADPIALSALKSAMKSLQPAYGINCWHKNEVESLAMWHLYTHGKDGVAIQTTVGRLKACLVNEPRHIYIADVIYGHDGRMEEQDISDDALIPIVTKRRSFAHESEVRLILDSGFEEAGRLLAQGEAAGPPTGETVKVDIENLIERIVASPNYPAWSISDLQERVTDAGLKVHVETSDLLKLPETDKIPLILRPADSTSESE